MLFVTTYKVKPYISTEETKELMAVYAVNGDAPGTKAHYIAADGSHGVVITELDDATVAYKSILPYAQWIEYHTVPVVTAEDAVPHILEQIG